MKNHGDRDVFISTISTPIGEMLVLETLKGICLLEFVDRKGLDREVQVLLRKNRGRLIEGGHNFHTLLSKELEAFFHNSCFSFSVPLDIWGSDFQKKVWKTLIGIPVGKTRTYSQVAEAIGNPTAVRAVGNANARNPIAIVIPCHRLIGADGSLTGYGGGIWRKEWLFQHERKHSNLTESDQLCEKLKVRQYTSCPDK